MLVQVVGPGSAGGAFVGMLPGPQRTRRRCIPKPSPRQKLRISETPQCPSCPPHPILTHPLVFALLRNPTLRPPGRSIGETKRETDLFPHGSDDCSSLNVCSRSTAPRPCRNHFAITALSNRSQTDQAAFSCIQRVEKSEADAGLNLK